MRAVAVHVNEVAGVSGFVVPGMRVDVLISGMPPTGSGSNGTLTKTILQNVEVLSAGQNIQKDAEGKPIQVQVVNLLVTPEDAETLSLASNEARIQLVLRNPLDTEVAKTSGTTMSKLFAGSSFVAPAPAPARSHDTRPAPKKASPPPVVAQVQAPPPVTVEVIQGTKKSESKFQEETEVKP